MKPSSAWDDPVPWRILFDSVAAGRREALGDLYDLASRRLFGLALWRTGSAEDAEEVVQEVFVRVAEARDSLTSIRDPRWWLLKLAHRIAVDVTRRRRRRGEPPDSVPFVRPAAPGPEEELEARRLSALVAELSPKQRVVVYLHVYAGMSHAEIGRSLGIPTFTAASRYRLALEALRRRMGGAS